MPESKEWEKVDPLFQELRSNHYYKDLGWSERNSCYLEGEKQTSEETNNSFSVNQANNSNLCKNFDAFEEEILPGCLRKAWTFPFHGLFGLLKFF